MRRYEEFKDKLRGYAAAGEDGFENTEVRMSQRCLSYLIRTFP